MALTKRRGRPAKVAKVVKRGRKTIQCLFCHADGYVDADTLRFVCANCVITRVGGTALPAAVRAKTTVKVVKLNKDGTPRKARSKNGMGVKPVKATGRGRGWHLAKYFFDPKTDEHFSYGVKLTNKKDIADAKKGKTKAVHPAHKR